MEEQLSEENIMQTISEDPILKKNYLSKLEQPTWKIPLQYENEIRDLLKSPVPLLVSINSPEDYKTLVEAITLVRTYKERSAEILHHLKALNFRYKNNQRRAQRYIEKVYYLQLNKLKDSVRKSILSSATEGIEDGVNMVEYLLNIAEMAQTHLNDTSWSIKNSGELLTSYFSNIKAFMPTKDI